ncbi:MAG: outer membrane beta-barrel protein [Flavobacteriaceae bacterium]|nr:outer membrane beta-barrel protein [Flavobacteriaceae bacterium]
MKKFLFILILFGTFHVSQAQFFNFGIKGGINYNSNGDLSLINNLADVIPLSSNEETGYHFGFFTEIKLPLWLYLRPELIYTHTESSYSIGGNKARLVKDLIEAPILVGFRVFKIGRFFFGPSFQYAINTDLKSNSFENLKKTSSDDFTVAGQVGLGLNFGKLGADIRWEAGLSDSAALFQGNFPNETPRALVDTSQQQFILSFYYKFK